MNWAIAAKATKPIEASERSGETSRSHASASATMATIDTRRVTSSRWPIVPPPAAPAPRMIVGKTRSFETMVASAVASTITIDDAALIPPSSAAPSNHGWPSAAGSAST